MPIGRVGRRARPRARRPRRRAGSRRAASVPTCTRPVAGVVGEPAGAYDGPVEVARAQVVVGRLLGPQVHLEHVVAVRVGLVGAHRGDHHVAPYAGLLRGVGEQHRGALVDGLLARGAAVRAAAGGEHHGVGALDDVGQRGRRRRARGRARRPRRRSPRRRRRGRGCGRCRPASSPRSASSLLEQQGDLSVSSGDDDAHGLLPLRVGARRATARRGRR